MSLTDLASLGSFVSGIAVLVSLVYLSLQVQQNRKHMAAQISQARVQIGAQQQEKIITDPAFAELMLRGGSGDTTLNPVDSVRFSFFITNTFMMIEDEFRQHQAGLISDARHNGFVKRFSRAFRLPGWRAAWALQREGFEPDFQAFMDPLVHQGRELGFWPDPGEAWRAAVAAELEPHRGDSRSAVSTAVQKIAE